MCGYDFFIPEETRRDQAYPSLDLGRVLNLANPRDRNSSKSSATVAVSCWWLR